MLDLEEVDEGLQLVYLAIPTIGNGLSWRENGKLTCGWQ